MTFRISWFKYCVLLLLAVVSGCAELTKLPVEGLQTAYIPIEQKKSEDRLYAPVFLTYNYNDGSNRIGTPSAKYDKSGDEEIFVDSEKPSIYFMKKDFQTAKGKYTNYIYRIHFPGIPYSLIPFHLTAGKNVGLMIFVTVNSEGKPVLVCTAHTCGCYKSFTPTNYLPEDSLPDGYKNKPVKVYGERLPPFLDLSDTKNPAFIFHLRPGVHRVSNIEVIDKNNMLPGKSLRLIDMSHSDMDDLEKIPINGKHTSFYHQSGILKGHVKGSVKPFELMFLSLISLDLFVGADKAYTAPEVYDNPFYTSLKIWNRNRSNMWNFPGFLEFWGWRL